MRIKCESFTVISIDCLRLCGNKYYLQVYLDYYAYKIIDKQMIDCRVENPFENEENLS